MKVFAENRKARNSYEFQEFYEAGIVLTGPETKSVRTGAVSIVDAFAIIENEEAFLMEMNIEPYKYADQIDYDPIPWSDYVVDYNDNHYVTDRIDLT